MKRFVAGFSLAVALMASVCTGPAAAGPAQHGRSVGRVLSDVTITGKVKTALIEDKNVSANEINVDTVQGIVQLKGNVDSKAEARRAVAIAGKVDGVKKVKSFLKVVPNEKTASGKGRTAGQVVSDVTITGKVKTALMEDKFVPANAINVDTVKGIVQLKGKVASKAEVRRAAALARKVDGVKAVKSFLQIVPQEKTAGYRSQTKAKS